MYQVWLILLCYVSLIWQYIYVPICKNIYICIYTDGWWPCKTWRLKPMFSACSPGFGPDFSDERLNLLKKYDHLLVRLLALLVASPWFGLPTWIFALYPWLPMYHHWHFFHLTRQLLDGNKWGCRVSSFHLTVGTLW